MIPGIVLAAGKSSRMGQTKALLSLAAGEKFFGRFVSTLIDSGLKEIVVVVGADAGAIRSLVQRTSLPVRVVDNPEYERGQLSSLLRGLDAVDCAGVNAALVTLTDIPLVAAETVRAL